MSIQDRDQWIHDCFAENYDILVVRAKRRAENDPILRNEIEDCVIEAFEMAWSKYGQLKHHALHFPMQIRLSADWSRMKPVRLY